MGKTGSINRLFEYLNIAYNSHEKLSKTPENKTNASDIKSIAVVMREIGKSKDIHTIIDSERMILRYESEFYGKNNPQALKSLNEAIKEVDGASKALDIVKDKRLYQVVNDAHSPKDRDRKDGLPKDAFHTFTNSHKTRIGNRVRSIEASFEERLLLKERYENIKVAQREYMKLQAKSLDIQLPEKSKERER